MRGSLSRLKDPDRWIADEGRVAALRNTSEPGIEQTKHHRAYGGANQSKGSKSNQAC